MKIPTKTRKPFNQSKASLEDVNFFLEVISEAKIRIKTRKLSRERSRILATLTDETEVLKKASRTCESQETLDLKARIEALEAEVEQLKSVNFPPLDFDLSNLEYGPRS